MVNACLRQPAVRRVLANRPSQFSRTTGTLWQAWITHWTSEDGDLEIQTAGMEFRACKSEHRPYRGHRVLRRAVTPWVCRSKRAGDLCAY